MADNTYTVYKPNRDNGADEVVAQAFIVEHGALIFTDLNGKRIWAFAPGAWTDVVLTDEGK